MKTHAAILSVFLLSAAVRVTGQVAPAPEAGSAPLFKPGLWETTMVIEDAASTNRRSIVGRVCVRATETTTVQAILPVQRERSLPCENRDIKSEGTSWAWTVSCRSREATQSGVGRIALSGEGYVGRAELELRRQGAKAVKVKQTYSGKWLQPCA